MPTLASRISNRKRHAIVGLLITTAFGIQCVRLTSQYAKSPTAVSERVYAAAVMPDIRLDDPDQALAASDPLAFLRQCRQRYDRAVQDYTCTFTKQELIKKHLGPEQQMLVKFRSEPTSVNMKWILNADQADQVTYIQNRWIDSDGKELAWCKPAGAIIKLFIKKIQQPIHGSRAETASRRTIDQFGFRTTLDLIMVYCEKAAKSGELDLRYIGPSTIDGRPTLMFERLLPYTGQEEPYPDRLLVFHIDREWLLPTACFSYADDDSQQLLGKYITTDVTFNNGLSDEDFGPDSLGS